jgi:hypothetical protein
MQPAGKLYQGYSLHIGLNSVDPNAYGGWHGELNCCENDSQAMWDIADQLGYRPIYLPTRQATVKAVLAEITAVRNKIKPADYFLLTFSGHTGQVPDIHADE